jgi:UPF0755 protein
MRMLRHAALLLLLFAAVFGYDVYARLQSPLPLQQAFTVEVERGSGLGRILRHWQARGILDGHRQRIYLLAYARLKGQTDAIKAGEYELVPGMRAVDLTALLVSGRVVMHQLQLIEGWTFQQALAAVNAHPAIRRTLPEATAAAVMEALGHPQMHPEGRFFPDTYHFSRGTTEVEFLRRAFEIMQNLLELEWSGRDAGLPYRDSGEALIMASIIERETGLPEERGEIAGVFVRRLQKGMRLQTDPTVIYGLGPAFTGRLRTRDLRTDTPYNTYTRHGLPPTPICLPGRASIHAALHPKPGVSLYFVSRNDGSHKFSATLEEHNAAVRKYQLGGGTK